MQRVVILGAGGHAQVIADILLRMREQGDAVEPVGFLDDDAHRTGLSLLGLPIFGRLRDLNQVAHDAVIIGIGDNRTRARLFEQFSDEHFASACHPSAIVAPDAVIGSGTVIAAGAIIASGTTIGRNTIINTGSTVDHHNVVADHVHIAPGVHTGGAVRIGVGAFVGIGSTIIPQRTIGAWSMIGAGALVLADVPERSLVFGSPARLIKHLEPEA